ncbi:hypothetical protein DICPUDRAFT_74290 [Dictyostelium purpureum]|uniref:Uncharacterized protein n=1 Tax=Dictyostelium purpureum TaxID=5786 RepID=F0Z7B0_DICPU|nr:uncharacterized protein DICPUDRAFT_74290 [Dictyostelium purpureum]EGC40145.1 hypothetical protein DICPUDRAFT_74290 [Dictyostelium purpureum]|eukprot:XP_003283335.1 hypothetical protein DICPUDRAFT_74290 [Dictyostelium purpureum]
MGKDEIDLENINNNKEILKSNNNQIENIGSNNLISKKNDKKKKKLILLSIILFSLVIILLLIIGIYYSKHNISQNSILKKHNFINNKIEFQSFSQPELYFKSNLTSLEYTIKKSNDNNSNNTSTFKPLLKLIDTKIISPHINNFYKANQLFSVQLSTFQKNKILIQSLETFLFWKMTDFDRIELVTSDGGGDCIYFTLMESTVLGCSNCFKIKNCYNNYIKFTNNTINSPITSTPNYDDSSTIIKINVFK